MKLLNILNVLKTPLRGPLRADKVKFSLEVEILSRVEFFFFFRFLEHFNPHWEQEYFNPGWNQKHICSLFNVMICKSKTLLKKYRVIISLTFKIVITKYSDILWTKLLLDSKNELAEKCVWQRPQS